LNFIYAKSKIGVQCFISIGLILLTALVCYSFTEFLEYKVVAMILLVAVSIAAMSLDIVPVLLSAIASALIWNYFFIPPIFTFHINNHEDLLMFLLYFVIALVNAVLTFKIRKAEKQARAKEEKERTIKLYNTLINSLSHELRTPISTIIGAVDTLQEHKEKLSISNQDELLNQIGTAGLRLNRQVDNLLNMSRLDTGMLKPKLDWCDVNELVFSMIHKFHELKSHQIQFEPNDRIPLFKLDGGLMEQVLMNLIYNAIHYTPENSIIQILATLEAEQCILIVSDDGPGIPADQMNLIFDKFYRLPQSKTGGSGLGLSIVKGFVEAHNGTVRVENNMEGGAKFIIEIPAETSYIKNLKNE
jgi:two-component system, OmpR family, sensor histidine kinase KdpD